MSQVIHRVNLHQVGDLSDAVELVYSKINDLVQQINKSEHAPRCLLIGKSPTKSLSKRRFDLKKKGYNIIVVVAELDEGTALRLGQNLPDKCALQMSEMLSQRDYGRGISVIRQKRGTGRSESEPASLFVAFSTRGILSVIH